MPKKLDKVEENYQVEMPDDNSKYKIIIWVLSATIFILLIIFVWFVLTKKDNSKALPNINSENISEISSLEQEISVLNQKINELELNLKNQISDEPTNSGFKIYNNDYYSMEYLGERVSQNYNAQDNLLYDGFYLYGPKQPKDSELIDGIHLHVQVTDIGNKNHDDIVYDDIFKEKFDVDPSAPKKITISGKVWSIYDWETESGPWGPESGKEIFVVNDNKLYNISYSYSDVSNSNFADTIQKMLDSFLIK